MANTTNNYNLNKPLENEKVNISVLNQNMDIIDTNLKSLSNEIKSVKTDIPDISNYVKKETGKGLFSGSYNDLTNKPTIPSTEGLVYESKLNTTLSNYVKKSELPSAVTIDTVLSSTSTNPVQNKVVNSALENKANKSHGTHVSYSTDNPLANGTASVGTATTVSRSDHVHPLQTSVTKATQDANGNIITSSYVSSASINGTNLLLKSKSGTTLSTVDLSNISSGSSTNQNNIYYQTDEPSVDDTSVWIT